jgi:hypothetical protein
MLIDLDHIVREYIYVNLNYVIHCTKDEEMVIAGPLLTCLCIYANEIGGKTYHQIDYTSLLRRKKVLIIDYPKYSIKMQIMGNRFSNRPDNIAKYDKVEQVFGDPVKYLYPVTPSLIPLITSLLPNPPVPRLV